MLQRCKTSRPERSTYIASRPQSKALLRRHCINSTCGTRTSCSTLSSADKTIEALTNGTAEIGLILNPPVRDTIVRTEVFRDKIVAAVAPTHPLAGRKAISLQELAEFPFVLTERSSGVRQQIDRTFNRHAINPNVFCVTNSIMALVSFDRKCALLPRFAVDNEVNAGTVSIVPVKEFRKDPLVFCVC